MGEAKNNSDDADGQWKDRYLDIINSLETKQADAEASLELMQRYLKRWVQDFTVDKSALEESTLSVSLDSPNAVRKFLDTVDGYVRTDSETADKLDHCAWLPLLDLLDQQKLRKSLRHDIKKFRRQVKLGAMTSPFTDFEQLLQAFLDQQTPSKEGRNGLWQLLGKANDIDAHRAQKDKDDAEPTADEERVNVALFEQGLDVVRRKINGILYTLIDQINVPDSFSERKDRLRAELNQVADWEALPGILGETTSLVFISNTVHQHEFEGFLQALNAKLTEIQNFLSESREIESGAAEAAQALDSEVKNSIDGLNAALQDSDNLDDLKRNVQKRLENILSAFDRYQSAGTAKRTAVLDKLEKLSTRIEVLEDDSQRLRQVIEQQRQDSLKDSLTGLPNRQSYEEHANKEIARVRRHGHALSLIVADIDHFKNINDQYGHLAGDRVLKLVAQAMVNRLRISDVIARYGGEEFVILMPDTAVADALYATDQLRAAIENTKFHYQNQRVKITVSFGVTQVTPDDSSELAFQRADKALYEAKAGGRNCVRQSADDKTPAPSDNNANQGRADS